MKILFCTPQPVSHSLGISRVLIELKNELSLRGHRVDIVGPLELGLNRTDFASSEFRSLYTLALRDFLISNASSYDVVDYDHEFLPFDRSIFSKQTLFVARSVLLVQHLEYIKPKKGWTLRSFIGSLIRSRSTSKRLSDSCKTLFNADLINVPNFQDKSRLVNMGISNDKIVVIPFGLSKDRLSHFSTTNSNPPENPKVCFLGTFDYRKGAAHFGAIFRQIRQENSKVRLLLLGCGGMINDRQRILQFFDEIDHKYIDTVFKFEREKVGEYLKDCSLGIYPSYMEGFPFGILEMLTAYLPVVAFDSPGASMMLSLSDLVDVGDDQAMAIWVNKLLSNNDLLKAKRIEARELSKIFTWDMVASETLKAYSR